jgi:hypothetical protein
MSARAPWKKHTRDRIRDRLLATLVSLAALVVVACGQGSGGANCLPEDVERCTCADGRDGFEVCDPTNASGYGACNCELDASPYLPEAGVEASVEASAAGDGEADASGGGLVFMSACSTAPGSPQCPPGTSCDNFPAKGPHCSKPCTEATDCPPPSPGCNMMGVCKAP